MPVELVTAMHPFWMLLVLLVITIIAPICQIVGAFKLEEE